VREGEKARGREVKRERRRERERGGAREGESERGRRGRRGGESTAENCSASTIVQLLALLKSLWCLNCRFDIRDKRPCPTLVNPSKALLESFRVTRFKFKVRGIKPERPGLVTPSKV